MTLVSEAFQNSLSFWEALLTWQIIRNSTSGAHESRIVAVCLVMEGCCGTIGVLQNWQCLWLRVNHFPVSVHWGRTGRDKKEQSGKRGLGELGGEIERGRPGAWWWGRLWAPPCWVLDGDLLSYMHRNWECGVGPQNWGAEPSGTGRLLGDQSELSPELVTLISLNVVFVKY